MRAHVLVLAAALSLSSGAKANDIELGLLATPPVGKKPAVTIKVKKDLQSATIDIKSDTGLKHRQTVGPKDAGGEIVVELPHTKPGKASWAGTLSVTFADESSGSMPLKFQTQIISGFRFKVRDEDVDLVNHSLIVTSERDTAKIELEVYTDEGALLAATGKEFDNAKAGTPLKVEWIPKTTGDVLQIRVIVHDPTTAFQTVDLFPYKIEIPHEDVEFETGKHDIRASEEPKLVAAATEIDKAVKRFAAALKADDAVIRLEVMGHTDTVGSSASNAALSDRRANAIARWFAKRGVKVQIWARGVGEDMPKVDTPDETDEPRNRRVDYNVYPSPKNAGNAGWTRVN